MKNTVILFLFLLLISACDNHKIKLDNYNPSNHLSTEEVDNLKNEIIRHLGKLHKKATHETKFDNFFNEYYFEQAKKHELIYYVPRHTDEYTYFCFTRIAPSIKIKKVAIVGRIKRNEKKEIVHYEEIYRTWKFEPELLKEKNDILFIKLLNGEDLSRYYNHNSGEEEWIEFPDKGVNFNIEKRRWIKEGSDNLNETLDLGE